MKKRNVIYPLALAVFAFTMISCNGDEVPVKCKLTHLTLQERLISNGNVFGDTINLQLTYNAQGRLSEIIEHDEEMRTVVHYDNYGRVIKLEEFWSGLSIFELRLSWTNNEATITSFYRTQGGDLVQENFKAEMQFNAEDQITRMDYYERPTTTGAWELAGYELYSWQNNNVVKQEFHYVVSPASQEKENILKPNQADRMAGWGLRHLMQKRKPIKESMLKSFPNSTALSGTITFTYDSNKNPFANPLGLMYIIGWDPASLFSANNVLSYTVLWVGDSPRTITLTYTYNEEGYPLSRSLNEVTGWGQNIEKWNFTYECN
ncbi:MAG TPA: hypothetical protein VLH61_07920 [Bacteroidales bacterium]|nr:hypothetical protein [Bacteroidales bacterium]